MLIMMISRQPLNRLSTRFKMLDLGWFVQAKVVVAGYLETAFSDRSVVIVLYFSTSYSSFCLFLVRINMAMRR